MSKHVNPCTNRRLSIAALLLLASLTLALWLRPAVAGAAPPALPDGMSAVEWSRLQSAAPTADSTGGPDAFGYTYADSREASCTTTFNDISSTGTALGLSDDGEANIVAPFDLTFYGITSTDLRIGNNGGIYLRATGLDVEPTNRVLPLFGLDLFIAPYWDDFNVGSGDVYYGSTGSTPDRQFIVQWHDRLHYSYSVQGTATFQVIFYEGSSDIDFVYQDVDFNDPLYDNGRSATIGLNQNASNALQYSFDEASLSGISAICFQIPPSPIDSFPYEESFEADDGGWTADQTGGSSGNSWEWGVPANTVIDSAADGSHAWVTNLDGDYLNNEESFVVSPIFDFSTLTNPEIELAVWWESETDYDGATLQSSTDGGTTWTTVGASGDPDNWYKNGDAIDGLDYTDTQDGWTGHDSFGSSGWLTAKHLLDGLGGESAVLLRIAFGADVSVTYEGFAFDQVKIREADGGGGGGGPIHVDADAASNGDGSSWSTAYSSLQDALAAATPNSEIWVAAGVYYPDIGGGQTNNDRTAAFQLRDDVAIYGGFAATETVRTERNWMSNVTILSGDIDQNDVGLVNNVAISSTQVTTQTNSYHVVTASGVTTTAKLDGFTITAGTAYGPDAWTDQCGGGIYTTSASPTLNNLTLSGNRASNCGGGMSSQNGSNPLLTNVTFYGNTGYRGGGLFAADSHTTLTKVTFSGNSATMGGGMYNWSEGTGTTLTDVTFSNNKASGYVAAAGGGLFNTDGSHPILTNVIFSGNSAGRDGGAIYNRYSANPTLINVTFSDNSAQYGGAIYDIGGPVLTGATFSNNRASGGSGGGIHADSGSSATLTNVTFSGNSADRNGGGISINSQHALTLTHVTFSGNSASLGGGMYIFNGTVTVGHTIVANSTSGSNCISSLQPIASNGYNLDSDGSCNLNAIGDQSNADPLLGPLAYNGGSTQTHALLPGSPAIDAGAPAASRNADSDQRGEPINGSRDIGAFERQGWDQVIRYEGYPQSTEVNTAFLTPLSVTFVNSAGEPVGPGVPFVFRGPETGASLATTPITATSDAAGTASVMVSANGTAGNYTVWVDAPDGVDNGQQPGYSLTNTAAAPSEHTAGFDENGNLVVTLSDQGTPNNLTLKRVGDTLVLTDPDGNLPDGQEMIFPLSDFTGGTIVINGSANDDNFTLDLSEADLPPNTTIQFNGGDQASTAGDGLTIRSAIGSGRRKRVTVQHVNASDGSVIVGDTTVAFTGLEPVDITGTPLAVNIALTTGADAATLSDLGGGMTRLDGATFEQTNFGNPQADSVLSIDLAGGNDTLTISSADFHTNTHLIIDGGSGYDTVTWAATDVLGSGVTTVTVGANLTFDAGSTFAVRLGDGRHDRVVISESASLTLNNATLAVSLIDGYTPGGGDRFVLIDGQIDPVCRASQRCRTVGLTNTFNGLAEGARVLVDGYPFTISYADNDVTLTAVNLVVSSLGDGNDGDFSDGNNTLKEATDNARDGDTITFAPALSGATLPMSQTIQLDYSITISGNVPITLSAVTNTSTGKKSRHFEVNGNPSPHVTLTHLTLADGADGGGGAIANYATLTIEDSSFVNNQTVGAYTAGGAIANYATLTVRRSTFSGNSAADGALGGAAIDNFAGHVTIENSTFSGNSDLNEYGGIVTNADTMTITHSTFSDNTVFAGDAGVLANYPIDDGTLTLNGVLLGGNTGANCYQDSGTVTGANNLMQGGAGNCTGLTGTLTADPLLGPLADNGGPTLTHALLAGSPAIDAGGGTPCAVLTDQRGYARTDQHGYIRTDGTCDIGAYEAIADDMPLVTVIDDGDCLMGISVTAVDAPHPTEGDAQLGDGSGIYGQGRYWTIEPVGCASGFTLEMALPSTVLPNGAIQQVCRYTGSGNVWDCRIDAINGFYVARDGVTQLSDWAIFSLEPNAIELLSFDGAALPGGGVRLTWETASEIDTAGFNVLRGRSVDGSDRLAVNSSLIAATGSNGIGNSYQYDDATAGVGTWYYWLVEIDTAGQQALHGPLTVEVRVPTAVGLQAQSADTSADWVGVLLALGVVTLLALWRRLVAERTPGISAVRAHYAPPTVETLAGNELNAQLGPARAFSQRSWEDEWGADL